MPYSTAVGHAAWAEHFASDIINELYYNARGQRIKVKYENGLPPAIHTTLIPFV